MFRIATMFLFYVLSILTATTMILLHTLAMVIQLLCSCVFTPSIMYFFFPGIKSGRYSTVYSAIISEYSKPINKIYDWAHLMYVVTCAELPFVKNVYEQLPIPNDKQDTTKNTEGDTNEE